MSELGCARWCWSSTRVLTPDPASHRRSLQLLIQRAFDPKPSPLRDAALLEFGRVCHNTADSHVISLAVSQILRLRTRVFSPLRLLVDLVESPTTPLKLTNAAAYVLAFICDDAVSEETMRELESERVIPFLLMAHNVRNQHDHPSLTLSICSWALANIAQAAIHHPETPLFRAARQSLRAVTPNLLMRHWRRDDLGLEDRIYVLEYMGVLAQIEGNPTRMLEQHAVAAISAFIIREAAHQDVFVNVDFPLRFRSDLRIRALSEAINTLGLLVHNDPTTPHLAAVRLAVVQDAALMSALSRCVAGAAPDAVPPLLRQRSIVAQLAHGDAPSQLAMPSPVPAAVPSILLGHTVPSTSGPLAAPKPSVPFSAAAFDTATQPSVSASASSASLTELLRGPSPSEHASPMLGVESSPSSPALVPVSHSMTAVTPPPTTAPASGASTPARQRHVFVPVDARQRGYVKIARHPHHFGMHAGVALLLANCFQSPACVQVVHQLHPGLIQSMAGLLAVSEPQPHPEQAYGALALANTVTCRAVFDQIALDNSLVDVAMSACARVTEQSTPQEKRFPLMLLFNLATHSPVNLLRAASLGAAPVLARQFLSCSDADTRRMATALLSKLCSSPILIAVLIGADCRTPLNDGDVELIARAGLWCCVKSLGAADPALLNAATNGIIHGQGGSRSKSSNHCPMPQGGAQDVARRCPHCRKGKQGAAPDSSQWKKRHKRALSFPEELSGGGHHHAPHSAALQGHSPALFALSKAP